MSADATTGFQVVSELSDNFNLTAPEGWSVHVPGYIRNFMTAPRLGKLCDPHNFTIGDTLYTSTTVRRLGCSSVLVER